MAVLSLLLGDNYPVGIPLKRRRLFNSHDKGYPTELHKQRLVENGINAAYRMTGRQEPKQINLF
jgi:hypothetical protein